MLDIERIKELGYIYKKRIRAHFERDGIDESWIKNEENAINHFITYLERVNNA